MQISVPAIFPGQYSFSEMGSGGGRVVLGKLPVLGHPSYLNYSRARAYCTCSRCG